MNLIQIIVNKFHECGTTSFGINVRGVIMLQILRIGRAPSAFYGILHSTFGSVIGCTIALCESLLNTRRWIFILSVIGILLSPYINVEKIMQIYFTQDRISGIATFFTIVIGIYVAVLTVIATSEIGISKKIIQNNIDDTLIVTIVGGMIENLLTVGVAIFGIERIWIYDILLTVIVASLVSFTKFVRLVVLISRGNMKEIAKNIEAEEHYKNAILTYLEDIHRYGKLKK